MKISKQLKSIPLFSKLSDQLLDKLAMIATDQEIKRNQTIFLEGDDATGLYIVSEGRVKVYKLSFDGKEQILHILGPGEPFGEVAVFMGGNYPASSMTMEKSRIFFIPRDAFNQLITREPEMALSMLATLSMRLHQFANMIESLSLKEVPARLATYILLLSEQGYDNDQVKLSIAKTQLASYLGTIPETLSRILTKMVNRGYINSKGNEITIMDRDGLEDLAEGMERL